jgi:hypothetical protein
MMSKPLLTFAAMAAGSAAASFAFQPSCNWPAAVEEDQGSVPQWTVHAAVVAKPPSIKIATIELAGFEIASIFLTSEPAAPAPDQWCAR